MPKNERTPRAWLPALALGLLFALAGGASHAEPSVPWTPSAAARHALELLADEGGLDLPVTQWPLPRAAVVRALDALPRELPPALDAARSWVASELRDAAGSALSLTLRGRDEALAGFGDDATPCSSVGVRSGTLAGHGLALQLGARLDGETRPTRHGAQFRLDGMALATEAFGVQLQAWSHRSWWGPGWQSSLVLGNNAPPFNGVGLQRASAGRSSSPWLAWMGPWSYDFFIAQNDDTIHSYVVGTRLTMRPFSHLEIGLTRTAQWGGAGHQQSVHSFLRMLAGIGVNADDAQARMEDPANEMAGYDLRLRCGFELRCALYTQLTGEDATHGRPARFLGLYGFESWSADGRQRWFAEFAETICGAPFSRHPLRPCAYRNHAYPEGYAHDTRWIGAAIGADSRVWTVGWLDAASGTSLRVHAGRIGARVGVYAPDDGDPVHSGRVTGFGARQSWPWGFATLGAEVDWLLIAAPQAPRHEARLGLNVRMQLDEPWRATREGLGRSLAVRDGDVLRPLLTGAALIGAAALLDRPLDDYARDHGGNPSAKALRHVGDVAPFIGFGLAGASWLASHGSVQGDVAFSAMLASVSAYAASEVIKLAVDRARPIDEQGAASFGDVKPRTKSSFPSVHAALAWAVVTPYAEHYDMPWLYGVAALTNVARASGRKHWFSDTVAGAALGYAIGDRMLRARVNEDDPALRVNVGIGSVVLSKSF